MAPGDPAQLASPAALLEPGPVRKRHFGRGARRDEAAFAGGQKLVEKEVAAPLL